MSRLRLAVAFFVALIVAAAIVIPERLDAQTWVVKETQLFTSLVPSSSWRVLATDGGIDISSPSADEDVSFAMGGWTGGPLSPATLAERQINFMSYTSGDLLNPSISANGSPKNTTAGTIQRFD